MHQCIHFFAPISLGIRLLTNMELSILCGIEDMSSNQSIANITSHFELQFSIPLPSVGEIVLEVLFAPSTSFCTNPGLYKMGIQGLLLELVFNYPCLFDQERQTSTTTYY